MARPLRIEYPGALYHVTSRGNRQMNIYENDGDRVSFMEAHRTYRYTQREIGETVGLSVGMVSRITRMEERVSK